MKKGGVNVTETEALLQFVAQNARMGIENITNLLTKVKDKELEEVLEGQRKGYVALHEEALKMLKAAMVEEREPQLIPKMAAFIGLQWNTMADKSVGHIAQLLVEGGTMGVIDITRHLKDNAGASPEATLLANRLLLFEEGALEKFKQYV